MKYKKARKISYNKNFYRIIIREDNKIGFMKIVGYKDNNKEEYTFPTAQEFFHLSSVLNVNNSIKF